MGHYLWSQYRPSLLRLIGLFFAYTSKWHTLSFHFYIYIFTYSVFITFARFGRGVLCLTSKKINLKHCGCCCCCCLFGVFLKFLIHLNMPGFCLLYFFSPSFHICELTYTVYTACGYFGNGILKDQNQKTNSINFFFEKK